MRTQVGIVGAGPAGLLLSHLLALAGVDSVVLETHTREYCETRQRAGVLEHGSVELLRAAGLGDRLDRQGIEHGGIYLQFDGERHHLDFRDLTGGRTVTVYAQTEVVKDLIAARLAAGGTVEFEATATGIDDLTGHPAIRYVTADGARHELRCDVIAGCDGYHGICRQALPSPRVYQRDYPYGWLGILADVPPSTDDLIYAHHPRGFSLHSLRSHRISRLYLQVPADEKLDGWTDERIWSELATRLGVPGWQLRTGPILERGITAMRSVVAEPLRYANLFLAGDAAHIVPPTGAKGLNLAINDVAVLAGALTALLRDGDPGPAGEYSATCLARVWRATHFSWWMTSMLHTDPAADPMSAQLALSQLRYTASSRAAATSLAENYVGYPRLPVDELRARLTG